MLIFVISILLKEVFSTIDINLAEFTYLANHLSQNECKQLSAALHFDGKNVINENAIHEAERKVPDSPCLNLLLHWNSQKVEGLGKTHESLRQSLIQIKRQDLADWLGRTVFNELGNELEKGLKESSLHVSDKVIIDDLDVNDLPTISLPKKDANKTEWSPFDTLATGIIVFLTIATLIMLGIFCYYKVLRKRKKFKKNRNGYKEVKQSSPDLVDESESEEKFNIRNYQRKTDNKQKCDFLCGK